MIKKILVIAAILIAIFGILLTIPLAENRQSENYKAMFAEYEIIYVNGADYKVDDIVSLQYHDNGSVGDSITLILKDGTVINFDTHNYALKNKQ